MVLSGVVVLPKPRLRWVFSAATAGVVLLAATTRYWPSLLMALPFVYGLIGSASGRLRLEGSRATKEYLGGFLRQEVDLSKLRDVSVSRRDRGRYVARTWEGVDEAGNRLVLELWFWGRLPAEFPLNGGG